MSSQFKLFEMKFKVWLTPLVILILVFWSCTRKKDTTSQIEEVYEWEKLIDPKVDDKALRDSVFKSYFFQEYSIHIVAKVEESDDYIPHDKKVLLIYNSNGATQLPYSDDFLFYLDGDLLPLEPKLKDYFLIREYNTGNCCRCNSYYVVKITSDEVKIIGRCNGFENGNFYYYVCEWPWDEPHSAMKFFPVIVSLINDSLCYPENFNF